MDTIQALSYRALSSYLVTSKEFGTRNDDDEEVKFSSPTRAFPSDVLEGAEEFHKNAGDLHEVLIELTSSDFSDLSNTSEGFVQQISEGKANVPSDATAIALLHYTGNSLIPLDAAISLIETVSSEFDFLVTPLMSAQIDESDTNDNPESYNRFIENAHTILKAANQTTAKISILGTIPVVPWGLIEEDDGLLDLYLENEVSGFCIDFLDKKPTTKSRVKDWITPFSYRLGREGIHRQSILYAVNANRGANRSDSPGSSAEDFYVFGLGFDVLGRRFYHSRTGWVNNNITPFRCFDRNTYEHRIVDIDELGQHLPNETGFDANHVLALVSDREHRIRLQELIESEQMALGYTDLRDAIQGNLGPEFIREMSGTQESIETRMEIVKTAFDEGSSNPSLSTY